MRVRVYNVRTGQEAEGEGESWIDAVRAALRTVVTFKRFHLSTPQQVGSETRRFEVLTTAQRRGGSGSTYSANVHDTFTAQTIEP
jgi:hypothetical protein